MSYRNNVECLASQFHSVIVETPNTQLYPLAVKVFGTETMKFIKLFWFSVFVLIILCCESYAVRVPDNHVVCPPNQKYIKKRCRPVW